MAEPPTAKENQRRAQAAVISKHLPSGYSAEPDAFLEDAGDALLPSEQESSLNLQGGDIHRDLFTLTKARLPKRAATFTAPRRASSGNSTGQLTATETLAPGGFRRQYMLEQYTVPGTKTFVDFLDLFGGFAGEDLHASDNESDFESVGDSRRDSEPTERRPLLRRQKSSKQAKPGDAGTVKTFFTLIKAFIGTGILFLPKAFNNGGLIFSLVTLVTVSLISCICFHLLLLCRAQYGGGYGELGGAIGGPRMRSLILASITISQIGFVCTGLIFTAENLYSFFNAVMKDSVPLSTNALIGIQLVVLIPLAWIRNIAKLGPVALLADICIAFGLAYIWYYDVGTLAQDGLHPTVQLYFNPSHYTLTVGSAIFTFEGIGLILPIQSSMAKPGRFRSLLYLVMVIITVIFASVGFLSYATFGSGTRTEIITNFPQTSKLVNAVQFIYSFAVLVGTPVQLFPAMRIIENKVFGHYSGKRDASTKWKKNALRTAIVVICGVIAALGASDLDKFVALIGSFACIPLVYIYPAVLHYRGVAESRGAKAGDVGMVGLGLVAMVYTTFITVMKWIEE